MKKNLICAMAVACAAVQLAAMPTEEETKQAEPVVKKLLAQERVALESGKKTRSEVAAAAMKLAGEADTDAAKLLLMKGAFVLYVKDGNLEKAVETMNALETAISDMPPQSVTNMIEMALLGISKKVDGARLYKLLDENRADIPSCTDLPSHIESKAIAASVKERSSVASILKGMIKVPGRDFWLSATELTQGQWESVMGYNLSQSKGVSLPVENVSRYDCDVFFERLNQTKEVQASQFEFRLPSNEEWECAARAGHLGACWVKPGVVGDILNMAWLKENSSNQLQTVATKASNAFGFYDMLGNVWEWIAELDGSGRGIRRGLSCYDENHGMNYRWYTPRQNRWPGIGLRLAAHIRSGSVAGDVGKAGSSGAESAQQQATVDGYTWSYRVKNREAMIVTTNGICAVSPSPKGDVSIPSTLDGVKVTSIGNNAFRNCRGLTSVTIPENVTSIGDHAFEGCCELKSVTIPYSVRNIGEWAFNNCYALKLVTIPSNVERIGGGAFCSCRGLMSVTIPAKVASIGGVAFAYCSALKRINVDAANPSFTSIDGVLYTKDQSVLLAFPNALTSVKIPKGVTNIGGWAFEGCNGLKSVTIPEGVTTIENNAFKECGGLESVVMPSGLKKIGWDAFDNCRSLKSVTIPDGVCDIGGRAFRGCGELASLTLPKGLTTIGDNAFWGCGKLTSLTLPKGLMKIGRDAFRGLGKLTTVTIPAEVTSIGGGVFSYCGGLTQINVEAGNQKYTSVDGVLYTKDLTELVTCPNGLTSVTIPESVTSIGGGAFAGCSKLTSLMLPSSVKSIGGWAFEACNGLTSVTIPEGVTGIGQYAFNGCGELTSVTMRGERPDAPKNIFERCGKLKSIHVPANAKSWEGMKDWLGIPLIKPVQSLLRRPSLLRRSRKVGEQQHGEDKRQATVDGYTWSYRVNNGEATIVAEKDGKYSCAVSPAPKGDIVIPATLGGVKVTRIGRDAFANCHELTSVNIPQGVTSIDQGILWNCSGLKSVVLPSGLKTIGMAAFSGCSGLTSVTIPEGVTHIGYDAFSRCSSLTSVVIPSGVDVDARAFSWCHGLKSVTIAKGVTRISQSLFVDCTGLKSVTIPEGVTEIGVGAFMGCRKLGSVTIPASVTNIEIWAFSWCEALKQINVADGNKWFASVDGVLYTKDLTELVICPNDLASVMIPEGVGSIRPGAFRGCSKLTSVMIPASVESCSCAFEYCGALKQINVDVQNQKYASVDGVVYTKDLEELVMAPGGLKSVPIPAGVKRITSGAFKGCSTLTSVTIPAGVDRILPWTFEGCTGLESVTIQGNVTYIGHQAFWACRELTSFTMRGERPEAPNDIFMGCGKLKAIHVPANAKSWAGMKDWLGIPLVFDAAESNVASSSMEDRSSVASILKGMIKVPGRDYWLSETELTQGQWESVMGYNLSSHKGANLPVENVSRDDCDVFLEKLNQTEEVKSSQFEFRLPELEEWKYAAWAGSAGHGSWIKPGIVGDVLDMAWVEANSSNQTHAVATKAPNAFGFYDMLGNVWEWLSRAGGDAPGGCGSLKGCAFTQVADKCTWNQNWHIPTTRRHNCVGLRLAANIKPQRDLLGRSFLRRRSLRSKEGARQQKTDGRDDAVARSTAYMHDVYCVIDISGGSNAEHYPVSYLDSVPEGGWSDEYKTTKIALRRVAAGTYPMLGKRKVTFTKPFYIGIFELTQRQIKLLSGDNNRKFVFEGDMRPADCLTWEEMRGKNEEFDYPKTKEVAPDSIIGKLRAKTGLFQIDLPTSYQFGCAWNAGTDGSGRDARSAGRHFGNQRDGKGGYTTKHTIVGSYQPNEWGIYDLHGNVWEMCLDHSGSLIAEDESDPVGPMEGEKRQLRGGCWNSKDEFVFADFIPLNKEANDQSGKGGCRIVINVEAERVSGPTQKKNVAAEKLQSCDFLLNKDFKKNAKYYFCLFSASWCGPCRAEMPRIAKTYAETLKDDPNIELIHFSWDQNDEKALAWAKEHDVKFPVVKPKGGNPLDLHTRGIPHLFIVKADGTLVEEGHPMTLFTDEKLRKLKVATP